jgi:hypothetical protein
MQDENQIKNVKTSNYCILIAFRLPEIAGRNISP